jgi:membrane protein required for beta-lactamase induction
MYVFVILIYRNTTLTKELPVEQRWQREQGLKPRDRDNQLSCLYQTLQPVVVELLIEILILQLVKKLRYFALSS